MNEDKEDDVGNEDEEDDDVNEDKEEDDEDNDYGKQGSVPIAAASSVRQIIYLGCRQEFCLAKNLKCNQDEYLYTVCPRSLDPFYTVNYCNEMGQDFLAIQSLKNNCFRSLTVAKK